ncbi:SDR family NAD(P)-dependent oxidoreductase [Xanthomonas theicola]|uniref:SDR family NAD(P)-dependent oxidoreductase n=1 Tax=Xanthomonas theicola TaxID=56464 RepID=UPI001FEB6CC4|nr:SDR family oxidoreductase [Xanthomonas theicola]
MAAVRCNHAALPLRRASGHGGILNISSIDALRPTPRVPAYSAAKPALHRDTTTRAAGLARERIRAKAIAPDSIAFPRRPMGPAPGATAGAVPAPPGGIGFGSPGTLEEIAHAVLFLAAPQARWSAGQILAVDGGPSLGARHRYEVTRMARRRPCKPAQPDRCRDRATQRLRPSRLKPRRQRSSASPATL